MAVATNTGSTEANTIVHLVVRSREGDNTLREVALDSVRTVEDVATTTANDTAKLVVVTRACIGLGLRRDATLVRTVGDYEAGVGDVTNDTANSHIVMLELLDSDITRILTS